MKGTLSTDGKSFVVHIPMRLKRWGAKAEIIAPPGAPDWAPPPPTPHQAMLRALGRAHRWLKMLESGHVASMRELAEQEKIDSSYMSRILRLTLLAPDIIRAILDGRQPESLTLADLLEPLPMLWSEQRERLGFAAVEYD
ncbi:MAG: hypothetical protein HQM06_15865 [Magnetococcales bacterium]|nr:hypothetical protein [Magnetococcales bacterium]